MQQALDAAWTSADPNAKKLRAELFLNGKPSPEEFVLTLTRYIENPGAVKSYAQIRLQTLAE